MAFIPVPNTAAVTLDGVYLGEDAVNTLYFKKDDGFNAAQLLTLAASVWAWWVAELKPIVSQSGSLQRVVARDISVQNGVVREFTGSGPEQGGLSGTPLPSTDSFAIKFTTGFAGRSYRGRNFAWGLVSGNVAGNTVAASYADDLVSAYLQLFDLADVNSCIWVVVSRQANKQPRTTGVTTAISGVSYTDLYLDTMRNRAAGHGD